LHFTSETDIFAVQPVFLISKLSRPCATIRKQADQVYNSNNNLGARPFAIGINCTNVHKLGNLIQIFEAASKKQSMALPRLIIYPDGASGLIYDTVTQKWVVATEASDSKDTDVSRHRGWHEELADIVREAHGRGVWEGILVGGCCKTTPAHIVKLRQSLE
jgi:homocysteine S-methyltransferase